MNRHSLVARDLAAAALLGALPGGGDDFGSDGSYDYSDEFSEVAQSFGDFAGDFGYEPAFGYDPSFGDEFGANFADIARATGAIQAVQSGAILTPQQVAAVHAAMPGALAAQPAALAAAMRQHGGRSNRRAMLLEPNKGSSVAVERFVFGLEDQITALATPQTLDLSDTPDTVIRPQRVTANAPSVGFVLIQSMRVGNVDVSIGSTIDAFEFNANAQGSSLDMPTLKTSTKVRIAASYTGLVPSPLSGTGAYTFTVSFKGPSTLTP